ncbi:MAG: cytidylate kinase-like family protein [Deltaproteobacteria bacterium]|nr:cytidylate kinase-like family protein [Deltaproteobacteria bacterium]
MAVITISKEYGTDAGHVAALAAQKLGYDQIGKKLTAEIAKELNLSEAEVETFKQTSQSRIIRLVDRYTCTLVQKVVDREHGCLDDANYFESTKKLVENLYDAGNVIILGWGGQCILRGKPGTLHVRLTKDEDLKIEKIMQDHDVNRLAAKKLIEREEKDSSAYVKHYFNEDWNDARLYDLIIDMGKQSIEQAVEMICKNIST